MTFDQSGKYSLLDSIPVGIFVVNQEFQIQYWNSCIEDWTKIKRDFCLNKDVREIFPRLKDNRYQSRMEGLFKDGMPVILSYQLNGDLFSSQSSMDSRRAHHCTITALKNEEKPLALFAIEDMTEIAKRISNERQEIEKRIQVEKDLRIALDEKQILMNELNHRVKNNLNMISSLIGLQEDTLENERSKIMYRDLEARIDSISLLHEMLYKNNVSDQIRLDEYISNLCKKIFSTFLPSNENIATKIEFDQITVSSDITMHLGLIITELLTNAIKYGINDRTCGSIIVRQRTNENQIVLEISDDGPGWPQNFDIQKTNSLGMKLVCMMTEQIRGTLVLSSEQGAYVSITFPKL